MSFTPPLAYYLSLYNANIFHLNTEERSNDMNRGFVFLRRRTLLGQLDNAAGYTLQLSDVLTTLADDSAHLGTRYHDFDSQSNVV